MSKAFWEQYTLDELLLHLVVCLEWKDGYKKYGEGSTIAVFHNYELEFNDEYDSFNVKRITSDGSLHAVHRFGVRMSYLIDSIVSELIGREPFHLWAADSLKEVVLSRLDALQDVFLIITPEGKYIVPKKEGQENGRTR